MDLCMGMGALYDQGRGLNNVIDHNGYYAAPLYDASAGVKPTNLYELPMDAIHNLAANDNNSCLEYSCLPWHEVVDHPASLVLSDPLWQRHLMMQQRPGFESPLDSPQVQFKGGMSAALSSFEERQAALVAEVIGRGLSCNGNETVQETVHVQPPFEDGHNYLSAVGHGINLHGKTIKTKPEEEAIGYGNSLQLDHYFGPSVCDSSPLGRSSISGMLQQNEDKGRGAVSTSGSGGVSYADFEEGGGLQCAITNEIMGYDSLPDLRTLNGDQLPESINYQQAAIAMPAHATFNSVSLHPAPPPLNEFLPSESKRPAAAWRNLSNPSESNASGCKEQPAKRQRFSGCYTLEDILKKLPRGAAFGLQTIRSNESSPRNISPVAAPQFSSDLSLSSPRLSLSSPRLSCSGASSSDEMQPYQLYRKPENVSVEPQSIAARHRRTKIREKIRCLEKLIPLSGAKIDTAKMLEVAIKYVKAMQVQAQVLECMPTSPLLSDSKEDYISAGTSNPGSNDNMRSNAFDKGSVSNMSSSWNVDSLPNELALKRSCNLRASKSKLKTLSAQQMLHILATSPSIQRKLLSEELCVGTVEQYQMLAADRDSNLDIS